jgi:hypothetical protein
VIETLVNDLRGYIDDGGFVMPPLVAAAVLLWYGLGYRLFALRRGASAMCGGSSRPGACRAAGCSARRWPASPRRWFTSSRPPISTR